MHHALVHCGPVATIVPPASLLAHALQHRGETWAANAIVSAPQVDLFRPTGWVAVLSKFLVQHVSKTLEVGQGFSPLVSANYRQWRP
jgi:glutamine phosphoribosylpyrophosphate amidotransferase